ncbi:MAG: G5 domain-containing protein, partial [Clostridiales bacterium]|nr:G5 domain-containing protein [Clostridiales bacterium]
IFAITTRLFTFTIAAIEIHVNGEFEARMRTEADLEEVERLLHEEYRNDNTVGSEFVSGWETIIVQVNLEETEFFTPLEAYYRLDRTTLQPYEYIVKDRDTLGSIALSFGTTVNRIMLDNNLTSTLIRPGDLLTINTNLPLLAVRTFDDYRTPELIEMPVDTRYTDELPLHESRIVQQGQQGQQMTVERVTRVNNMEVSREMREPEITIEPVPHIVEVGTGAAAMERR